MQQSVFLSFAIACFSFSGALSSAAFRRRLPVFADRLRALLTDWQNTGVADAAELGTGLGVDTNPANNRVGRLVQIASPATAAKLKGEPYLARWHVDNHWSDGTRNPHALLLVVRGPLRRASLDPSFSSRKLSVWRVSASSCWMRACHMRKVVSSSRSGGLGRQRQAHTRGSVDCGFE